LLSLRANQADLRDSDLLIDSLFTLDWKPCRVEVEIVANGCNLAGGAGRVNQPGDRCGEFARTFSPIQPDQEMGNHWIAVLDAPWGTADTRPLNVLTNRRLRRERV
jgi:hypothetical protein